MADGASNNQKINDLMMGSMLSQKPSIDLMQNCDLPPPMKVFPGSDKTVLSSMNRVFSMMGREEENDHELWRGRGDDDNDEKLELLKALRLSQTRAREAEKKVISLTKERDCVAKAFLQESMQGLVYRQWVRLLEVEVIKLRQQWQQQEKALEGKDCEDGKGVCWINVALVLCLGIAGVGLAFGSRYLL